MHNDLPPPSVPETPQGALTPNDVDWARLLEVNGPVMVQQRIAAFLRLYARRIRNNERWDIPETMAAAYECAARALEGVAASCASSQTERHLEYLRVALRENLGLSKDAPDEDLIDQAGEHQEWLSNYEKHMTAIATAAGVRLNGSEQQWSDMAREVVAKLAPSEPRTLADERDERIAAKMREVFTLQVIQRNLRIKADSCRKLAALKADPESMDARNWNGLADELASEADALQLWIAEPRTPAPHAEIVNTNGVRASVGDPS